MAGKNDDRKYVLIVAVVALLAVVLMVIGTGKIPSSGNIPFSGAAIKAQGLAGEEMGTQSLDASQYVSMPYTIPYEGYYNSPVDVEIRTNTPGASIRYTIDGSDPTESSPLFTGQVKITRTGILKARAYKDGMLPSNIILSKFVIS